MDMCIYVLKIPTYYKGSSGFLDITSPMYSVCLAKQDCTFLKGLYPSR